MKLNFTLNRLFYKKVTIVFLFVLILFLTFFLIKKKFTTIPSGGSCGGLIAPKYKLLETLGLFPGKCSAGYICDYPNSTIADIPGTCKKIILGEVYSVVGSPLVWEPPGRTISFLEEKLNVTILGFDDECEKYNKDQGRSGCVNAGEITWYIEAKKGNQKTKFSISSKRHESRYKEELGYNFIFPDIDRFNLKLKVIK